MKYISFLLLSLVIASSYSQTNTALDSINALDEVILSAQEIFGSKFTARNRTGSSYYLSSEELQKFNYTDINRALKAVPGLNIYEEDGFGLRPNISLRGTSPERSAKISLMEDGVLIAPAPYSSPSAYYFPSIARMQAVEILKGSSQVQYGPFTTGGAINFVSYQIPDEFEVSLNASYGTFNSGRYHVRAGDQFKNVGYAVEYLKYNSTGFKNIDVTGDSGFDIDEVLAKVRLRTDPTSAIPQSLEIKFQYSDEVSDETYVGLTDDDFEANPFRRYASTQEDVMNAEHLQLQATHILQFSKDFRITTIGYLNNFKRNWDKLQSLQVANEDGSINDVIDNPTSFPTSFGILTGILDSENNAIILRNNNRAYYGRGVQTKLDYHWSGESTFHDLEIGLRYHEDQEDRFQWEDGYRITNGFMELTNPGTPGTQANRISDAAAIAAYATYRLKWNKWTFTPGIRYENILLSRTNFGTSDLARIGLDISERENDINIVIPGVGFGYKVDNKLSFFGGVHKGFSPPGSQPDQDPEESINYEIGSRFNASGLQGELTAFYNDYSNLLGADTNSSGGQGTLEQFNAGEVRVQGLEMLLNYTLLQSHSSLSLPVTIGYTYTDTEFLNNFGSDDDLWGEVTAGDELPYLAKHQLNMTASLEHKAWGINFTARYNGAFRTQAGSGIIASNEKVPSNFIIDLSGNYNLSKNLSLTANVINMLNEQYAVSRVPAGLRPGHPFGAFAGIQLNY